MLASPSAIQLVALSPKCISAERIIEKPGYGQLQPGSPITKPLPRTCSSSAAEYLSGKIRVRTDESSSLGACADSVVCGKGLHQHLHERKGTETAYDKRGWSGDSDGNGDEACANSGPGIGVLGPGSGRVDVFAPVRFSQACASTSSSRSTSCASAVTPISSTFSSTSVESLSPGIHAKVEDDEEEDIALTALAARPRRSSSMSPAPALAGIIGSEEHHQRRHLLYKEEEEEWVRRSRNYGGTQEQVIWRKTDLDDLDPSDVKTPDTSDESDHLLHSHSTSKGFSLPHPPCPSLDAYSPTTLGNSSARSPTESDLEAGLVVGGRFEMAFSKLEMLLHIASVGVVSLLIILSMWLTIARIKM